MSLSRTFNLARVACPLKLLQVDAPKALARSLFMTPHFAQTSQESVKSHAASPRMHGNKDEFVEWAKLATSETGAKEYLELYEYAEQCNTEAEFDKYGGMAEDKFETIISATSEKGAKEYLELYQYANQAFIQADGNKDGVITENEFGKLIARIAFLSHRYDENAKDQKTAEVKSAELKKLFKEIDKNKDGRVDFSEFLDYAMVHLKHLAVLLKH